jgi:hypothetical protein
MVIETFQFFLNSQFPLASGKPFSLYPAVAVIGQSLSSLGVHKSVHRNTKIKITNKMHYID